MAVYLGSEMVSAYAGGIKPAPTEEKEVIAGTEDITVLPSNGKQLSGVKVHPTPTEEKVVTPTRSQQTVSPSNGKHLAKVIVNGDTDLRSENIKSGVNIFGVSGTLKGGFPNGTEWTQSNITSNNFYCVYYANGIWVAGSDSNGLYYSDGITWTQSNITSNSFTCVYNANGIWVAGSADNGLYYSTGGMTWTQSNITIGSFTCVYNANGIWVAGSSNGLYSSVTWWLV